MCTLPVNHAQHCTVNKVKAPKGWHTKIKILFTSQSNIFNDTDQYFLERVEHIKNLSEQTQSSKFLSHLSIDTIKHSSRFIQQRGTAYIDTYSYNSHWFVILGINDYRLQFMIPWSQLGTTATRLWFYYATFNLAWVASCSTKFASRSKL